MGKAIQELRKERGLNQEDAAHECKIDRSYFGALERGERNPTFHTLLKLAAGLKTSAAKIVARAEKKLR
jgi:transcriptional regulator with XRE-family HTH domain